MCELYCVALRAEGFMMIKEFVKFFAIFPFLKILYSKCSNRKRTDGSIGTHVFRTLVKVGKVLSAFFVQLSHFPPRFLQRRCIAGISKEGRKV